MKLFPGRSNRKYVESLAEALSLEGPGGLTTTAIQVTRPFQVKGSEFGRCIAIDGMGYCVSTLFDRSESIAPRCYFASLADLAARTTELNERGTFVRLRFLLAYPYSLDSQIRIQAEHSTDRTSVEEHSWQRGDRFLEQVDKEAFFSSSLVASLRSTLTVFYEWLDRLGADHALHRYPNRIDLRFASVAPGVGLLRINDDLFYEPYAYGKRRRHDRRCPVDVLPIVRLSRGQARDETPFEHLEDHFRYLWEADTTLDDKDVLVHSHGQPRFLPPDKVRYRSRVGRLHSRSGPRLEGEDLHGYEVRAARILRRHCPEIRPALSNEVAFVACSWSPSAEGEPKAPDADACTLVELIERYFGQASELVRAHRIEARQVLGTPGESLGQVLYETLDESTLGIVVLSPEIVGASGLSVARPNVYHELGYLMARLGNRRTFVFRESSVETPANIGDLVRIDYQRGSIAPWFLELVHGFFECGVVSADEADAVAQAHLRELRQSVEGGHLARHLLAWSENYVAARMRHVTKAMPRPTA